MNTPNSTMLRVTDDPSLSIGDLAERTGVSAATIRMWESRHGFPRPHRLAGGHRRYAGSDVDAVAEVLRRREAGVRLGVAIADARQAARPQTPSVFAELRRSHPGLQVHRLRKPTLQALSWAIEDEFCAKATRAHIFGAFQREDRYTQAEPRWVELSRVARSAFVYADFDPVEPPRPGPVRIPLAQDAPMRREWAVICDSVDLPIALTAWELPGQERVPDKDRVFESLWTVEPRAVRDAARVCARVAAEADPVASAPSLYDLAADPVRGVADLASVTAMFNRVVAYVDRFGSR